MAGNCIWKLLINRFMDKECEEEDSSSLPFDSSMTWRSLTSFLAQVLILFCLDPDPFISSVAVSPPSAKKKTQRNHQKRKVNKKKLRSNVPNNLTALLFWDSFHNFHRFSVIFFCDVSFRSRIIGKCGIDKT